MKCPCTALVKHSADNSGCYCRCHTVEELVRLVVKARDYVAKTDGYNDGNHFENKFINELESVIAQVKQ